jgi:uncharacterized protein YbgA (DUF1722 family)/uncharacterized protein YbbK (DUF523 family)
LDGVDRRDLRPVVVCSRCLGFDSCRYNGQMLRSGLVESLRPFVEFITPCPEADIGLGIPRHPVRVLVREGAQVLYQPATETRHTSAMNGFIESFFGNLPDVDGFILKSRSPSCGMKDVKQYGPDGTTLISGRGHGLFGGYVLQNCSHLAVEDEGRLNSGRIRDHFLTKLFTLADFRNVREGIISGKTGAKALISFQNRNKLLLMAANQKEMRFLGRLVADQKSIGLERTLDIYVEHLGAALAKGSTYKANINVLQHAFGYVSDGLGSGEKQFFLDNIEMYREGRTPLAACLNLLSSWIVRFGVEYLEGQTFFHPYPGQLQEKYDDERLRDYWK